MTSTSYKRILRERDQAFKVQDKRGQSKHAEKAALKEAARLNGMPCPQVRGLFSGGTFRTYVNQSTNFVLPEYYIYEVKSTDKAVMQS